MKLKELFRQPRFEREMLQLSPPIKQISLLMFIYTLGWGIAFPILPVYINNVLGSYTAVGIVFTALNFFGLFWALFLGQFLDKIQKRLLLVFILVFYLPLSPILLALQTLAHWIYFQFYHAVIATSLWLTSETYLREHSPKRKEAQAIGFFDFANGLALVIGGILCALFVTKFGFNIIYSVSIFALLALLYSFFIEDHAKDAFSIIDSLKGKMIIKELKDFGSKPKLTQHMLYTFPFFFVLSFMPIILPLFIDAIGASLPMLGIVAALFSVPMLFESYFSTLRQRKVLQLAMVFSALLFLAMFFASSIIIIFLLTLLLGISFSASYPFISGRFTKLMPKKEIGELSAVVFSTRSFAAALSPIVVGFIADVWGLNYVFLLGFVIFLGLIVFNKKVMG